ncbi:MAG: DUF4236 domain-containing protein [Deltaproteobacteria bacterium]|nr:DUF4236 domain-containing protein [Deltaproteobacteria bacterium]MBI3387290.1 DUF4236 domain-containing protein [Deltaproteobacteria bacterium]
MPFFLRKAMTFGPLRLNVSKSGLGVSVGVKGARIGIRGSDGQPYVHGGRYGLYYRQNLGSVKPGGGGTSQGTRPVKRDAEAQIERATAIVVEVLEETRDDWLPTFRYELDITLHPSGKFEDEDSATTKEKRRLADELVEEAQGRLTREGFPVGDEKFDRVTGATLSELMLQMAFPVESRQPWGVELDDMLGRVADVATQIVHLRRFDTWARVAPGGQLPTDQRVWSQRVGDVAMELNNIIMLELKRQGLVLESNPIYLARLNDVAADVVGASILHPTPDVISWHHQGCPPRGAAPSVDPEQQMKADPELAQPAPQLHGGVMAVWLF